MDFVRPAMDSTYEDEVDAEQSSILVKQHIPSPSSLPLGVFADCEVTDPPPIPEPIEYSDDNEDDMEDEYEDEEPRRVEDGIPLTELAQIYGSVLRARNEAAVNAQESD